MSIKYCDSLEEESIASYEDNKKSDEDVVPLYHGEVSKEIIKKKSHLANKKSKKTKSRKKDFRLNDKIEKNYLTIYKDKINGLKAKSLISITTDNETNIAICVNESSVCYSDPDHLASSRFYSDESNCNYDDELCRFDDLFMKPSYQNSDETCQLQKEKNKLLKKKPLYYSTKVEEQINKLEQLKKRQNYGMKVTIRNRIKMEEEKMLKKIQN